MRCHRHLPWPPKAGACRTYSDGGLHAPVEDGVGSFDQSHEGGYQASRQIRLAAHQRVHGQRMAGFADEIRNEKSVHHAVNRNEHHHHDGVDLFPDFGRVVPFGTGTSILYNYKDYRFKNNTDQHFQLIVYTTDEYLCGELRTTHPLENSYHIKAEDEYFSRENGVVYRNGRIFRSVVDKESGNVVEKKLIKTNHAEVMYDTSDLQVIDMDR